MKAKTTHPLGLPPGRSTPQTTTLDAESRSKARRVGPGKVVISHHLVRRFAVLLNSFAVPLRAERGRTEERRRRREARPGHFDLNISSDLTFMGSASLERLGTKKLTETRPSQTLNFHRDDPKDPAFGKAPSAVNERTRDRSIDRERRNRPSPWISNPEP